MSENIRSDAKADPGFAIAHISATRNNLLISITDTRGNTLCWASAGASGFKGSRRSSAFAGRCAAQKAGEQALKLGVTEVEVRLKGTGPGLDGAVEGLESVGLSLRQSDSGR